MIQWPIILENVLQALTAGLLVGSVYALMCVGLGLIFGVMRVINFAQGEFLMLGMYAALYAYTWLGLGRFLGPYVGPIVGAALAGILLYIGGILLHRYLLARVTGFRVVRQRRRRALPAADPHARPLAHPLQRRPHPLRLDAGEHPHAAVRDRLGARPVRRRPRVGIPEQGAQRGLPGLDRGGTRAVCLHHPVAGREDVRAAADNPEAATYMGIDVDRAHRLAFGLGSAITAVAGGLVATYYPFQPYVGLEFVIVMYAGVVLGGMGSIVGAFWGGLTIGLVQQLSTLVLPVQLQNAAIFVVFLLIILLRPQGLFGRNVERA